jgi:hypothetical protein
MRDKHGLEEKAAAQVVRALSAREATVPDQGGLQMRDRRAIASRRERAAVPRRGRQHLRLARARLDEAVANSADVLAEQHAAKLLEARWRVDERADDRLALGDRERDDVHLAPVGVREAAGWPVVVDPARARALVKAGEPHPLKALAAKQPGLHPD